MHPKTKKQSGSRAVVESLESRVLYSADPFGLGLESGDVDVPITAAVDSQALPTAPTDVFFVDERVPDYQSLIVELEQRQHSQTTRSLVIHTINSTQSLVDVGNILSGYSDLNSVQFITHGLDASVQLGSSVLNASTISQFESELTRWGHSINDSGDLLFYGCNLADTESGKHLIDQIATLTGAEVAASTDLTGHSSLGADWTLEYATGAIALESQLLDDGIDAWTDVLATLPVTVEVTTFDDVVDNDSDLTSVTNLKDNPGSDNKISLREAIIAANADPAVDIIVLEEGDYLLDTDPSPLGNTGDQFVGDLDVTQGIILQGAGKDLTTIDGNNEDRVFQFTGGTSTIEGVTITKGQTAEDGGGLWVADTTLTLNSVVITDNKSLSGHGGGIYAEGTGTDGSGGHTININDSVLSKNHAGKDTLDKSGGAIYNSAGGTVNVKRTDLSQNDGYDGGAIFNDAFVSVEDTYFNDNNALYRGGAISNSGTVEIDRSLFWKNDATVAGGAIENSAYALIHNTTFSNNKATANGGSGGAIYSALGTSDIFSSTFYKNKADTYGAIARESGTVNLQSSLLDTTNTKSGPDIHEATVSLGFNLADSSVSALNNETDLTDTDPRIHDALTNIGGYTDVHMLNPDSPAINAGASSHSTTTDNYDVTGAPRNEVPDIGSAEYRQTNEMGQLFWTSTDSIYRSNTDGTQTQVIITGRPNPPADIEVDAINGRLFWIEKTPSFSGSLHSANLDGSDIITLVEADNYVFPDTPPESPPGLEAPAGLTLDSANQRIFVTNDSTGSNNGKNSIEEYDYSGNFIREVTSGGRTDPQPNRMQTPQDIEYAPQTDTLFWSDTGSHNSGVQSIPATGTGIINRVFLTTDTDINPDGLTLDSNNAIVYWGDQSDEILQSSFSGANHSSIETSQQNAKFKRLEYHSETDTIYAIDTVTDEIVAINPDNSGSTVFYDQAGSSTLTSISVASLSEVENKPSLTVNDSASVMENGVVEINSATLSSINPDISAGPTVFHVSTFPSDGELWLGNDHQITTVQPDFTQQDLEQGLLEYRHNGAENPTDGFAFTLADSTAVKTFNIEISPVNDAPEISNVETFSATYTIGSAPIVVSEDITIDDAEGVIQRATAQITDGYYNSLVDQLAFQNTAQISGNWNGNNATLTLTSTTASVADFQEALRSITYEKIYHVDDTSVRIVEFTVSDGELNSTSESRSITIHTSDAPLLQASGSVTYVENSTFMAIVPDAIVTDSASNNFNNGELKVTIPNDATSTNALVILSEGTGPGQVFVDSRKVYYEGVQRGRLTGELDGSSPLAILLNGQSNVESVQAILRNVAYASLSDAPPPSIEFEVSLDDGDGGVGTLIQTINITGTNDAPRILNLDGAAISAVNNSSLHSLDFYSAAVTADADSPSDFDGGSLTVTKTGFSALDQLGIDTGGTIGLSNGLQLNSDVSVSGVVIGSITELSDSSFSFSFNENSTPARVDQIITSLHYSSTDTNFGLRSVDLRITDGDGTPNGGADTSTENINIYLSKATPHSVAAQEDATYAFTVTDFNFTGTTDDRLKSITITSLPAKGSLMLNGNPVMEDTVVTKPDLENELLTYTAESHEYGTDYTSFDFYTNYGNKTLNVLAGNSSYLSLDTFNPATTRILSNADNFGPDGTIPIDISIQMPTQTINADYLSQGTVLLTGFHPDYQTGQDDLVAIDNWITNGGTHLLIGESELIMGAHSFYNNDISGNGYVTWEPAPNAANHPILDGPFGSVDSIYGDGTSLVFNSNNVEPEDEVLATTVFDEPTVVLNDQPDQDGYTLYLSDENIFRTDVSSDGTINTFNDAFTANLFAWIIGNQAPAESHTLFVDVAPAHDPSELTLTDWATYLENGPAELIMPSATLRDYDAIDFDNRSISVMLGTGASTLDRLYVSNTATITINNAVGTISYTDPVSDVTTEIATSSGGESGQPLLIELNSDANTAITEELLRSISFDSTERNAESTVAFNVVIADGDGELTTGSGSITIDLVNDDPTNAGTLPIEFLIVEDTTNYLNLSQLILQDIDSNTTDYLTLKLHTGSDGILNASPDSNITIIGNSSNSIEISGTLSNLNSYLNLTSNVTYQHAVEHTNGNSIDTLTITLNDNGSTGSGGGTDITLGSIDIHISAVNDAPENTGTLPVKITVTEDVASNVDLSLINIYDIDEAGSTVTVTLTTGPDGRLSTAAVPSINTVNTGSSVALSGTVDALNSYLNDPAHIKYLHNIEHTNGTAVDTITVHVNDNGSTGTGGGVDMAFGSVSVDITAIDDAPELSINPAALEYTENNGSVQIDNLLALSDLDTNQLNGATVTITANYTSEDSLEFIDTAEISKTWDSVTGTLTLQGIATVAQYQEALRHVNYLNLSEDPTTATRTVEYTLTDGTTTVSATREIDINANNDLPIAIAIETTPLQYTENSGLMSITSSILLGDADDSDLQAATVTLGAGYQPGDESLVFIDQSGISGSWDTLAGELSLEGSSSIANYQTAIRSIEYLNNSDHPTTDATSIAITVNDGKNHSITAYREIEKIRLNDSPDISSTALPAIDEDDSTKNYKISNIVIHDDNDISDHLAGIAVVTNDTTGEGVWEYSLNHLDWHPIGPVNETNAVLLSSDTYIRFNPADHYNGTPTPLSVRAVDSSYTGLFTVDEIPVTDNTASNGGTTAFSANTGAIATSVNAVNDAPELNSNGELPDITEDDLPAGKTINDILLSKFSDVDAGSRFTGIAITDAPSINGRWQYQVDSSPWMAIRRTTDAEALVLDSLTQLRFKPFPDYFGQPDPLTIHALDDSFAGSFTTATDQETTNAQISGGTSSLSDPARISISVLAENDPPTSETSKLIATREDTLEPAGSSILDVILANYHDVDGTLRGIAISSNPEDASGAWQYAVTGSDWADIGLVDAQKALLLSASDSLRYVPGEDWFGTPPALTVRVIDDTSTESLSTATIRHTTDLTSLDNDSAISHMDTLIETEVKAVNDPPSGSNYTATHVEDQPYTFSESDFGFSDSVENHSFKHIIVKSLTDKGTLTLDGNPVEVDQKIATTFINNGLLLYTPPAHANGNNLADWDFLVVDSGDTLNSGQNTAADSNTITMSISAVNDAPTSQDQTLTTTEDNPITLQLVDLGFSDIHDNHSLDSISITRLPAVGTLLIDHVPVSTTTTISAADIDQGKLTWKPISNAHATAYTDFSFKVIDNGGTTNGGVDTSDHYTATINVLSVNDAPTGQDKTLTALEDFPYFFTRADFGFTDSIDNNSLKSVIFDSIPARGTITLFGHEISTTTPVSAIDIDAGELAFLSAPSSFGLNYTQVAFRVIDDGGTINGGKDTSDTSNLLEFHVLPVNDAPIGLDTTITAVEDTPYKLHTYNFGFSDALDGHALEKIRIDKLPASGTVLYHDSATEAGTIVPVTDIANGALIYRPAESVNGISADTIGFRVIDNGGTTNGGIDVASAVATITVDIVPVNDAPTGRNNTIIIDEDDPLLFSIDAFGFDDPDKEDRLSAVIIDSTPAMGTLTAAGAPVIPGQKIDRSIIDNGELIYESPANTYGPNFGSINFRVVDDSTGSLLNTSEESNTITIDVKSVNDHPTAILLSNTDLTENRDAETVGSVNVLDIDINDTHLITVDDQRFEVQNDQLTLKSGTEINFEEESVIPLQITAIDEDGAQLTRQVTLTILDVNDAPQLQNAIAAQSVYGTLSFTLPAQTFTDEDGDQLIYSATLDDGSPLPEWLTFDNDSREFSADVNDVPTFESVNVTVTATDTGGLIASTDINFQFVPEIAQAQALPSNFAPTTTVEVETEAEAEAEAETKKTANKKKESAADTPEPPGNSPQKQLITEDEPLRKPDPIPLPESRSIEVELIAGPKKSTNVTQANEALFIEVDSDSLQQQQAKENLITQFTLSKLANQMDDSTSTLQESAAIDTRVLGTSVTMASGLSVGYIFWILRSGTLLASILTSLPTWRYIDPLPVLDTLNGDGDKNDQETLESMVQEHAESDDTDPTADAVKSA